jgi:hypothetical protein
MAEAQNQCGGDSKHGASYQEPASWMESGEEDEQYRDCKHKPD